MPEPIQNALLALAFLACGGLHIVLRLLSLHLCNEYPSLPKKKKKKRSWNSLQLHQPQALLTCLQTVLLAMPAAWQTVASSAPAPATWQQGLSASGNQLIQNAQTGQLHAISPSQLLLPAQLQHISALCPVQVTPWDPSRPWRGPTAQLGSSAQSSNPLFTQGTGKGISFRRLSSRCVGNWLS